MTVLQDATRPLSPDERSFREVLSFVSPRPEEVRWEEIPWQTDLWEARRVALEVGKPIFAWMMNGSVLGCT
jgi:hypothetical protein